MRFCALIATVVLLACGLGCRDAGRKAPLSGNLLHLADALDQAAVTSTAAPASAREERRWNLTEPGRLWRVVSSDLLPRLAVVELEPLTDGVRLRLNRPPRQQGPVYIGGLVIDLDPIALADWETVLVRARSKERLGGLTVAYNLDEDGALPDDLAFIVGGDDVLPVFNDGSEQTYAIPLRRRPPKDAAAATEPSDPAESPTAKVAKAAMAAKTAAAVSAPVVLRQLAVLAGAPGPASIDILSVSLVPRGAAFVDDAGQRSVTRSGTTRATLFAHAPAALSFEVAVPRQARLDFALSVESGATVTYRVKARRDGGADDAAILHEETVTDAGAWLQRSVDLGAFSGKTVELTLEAASERAGAVALWGAPILAARSLPARAAAGGRIGAAAAGANPKTQPNIILYVIDGGGADEMSLYGFNRRTTPYLERLAQEGAVFERAHSNATWTQPSTASFMTSLQHSVLGGLRRGMHSTPVPAAAITMAQRMRRGGYQTAVFTTNPNCGRVIALERGVDVLRDVEEGHHSTSSRALQEQFWRFRDEYPGAPYWVHFQTTDVHEPNEPEAPFAGLFVSPAERAQLAAWDQRLWEAAAPAFGTTSIMGWYDLALERAGVDRQAYFQTRRGLYDETMAFQDHQLGRFVEGLKAAGEWENTLLIITADHGHPAGTFARFGRGLFDPQPEPWQGALFDSYATRVPLLFVWPAGIPGGQRFTQPVSLIDLLPTILELAGLPQPEILQGQSLAPLLRGQAMQVRPAILDEFRVEEKTGELIGNLEIVDGRWGASLEIGPLAPGADPLRGRHAVPAGGRWGAVHPFFPEAPRLLLYDLETDPFATHAVNDAHPELVDAYRRQLLQHWQAHETLAGKFHEAADVDLTPEQLKQLRALGYIQ